jgi:uncharacterized protein (DUF302 family)
MRLIKNLLAIIGVLALIAVGLAWYELSQFDPKAPATYAEFARKLIATKDPGSAMVYSVLVDPGISVDDVKESMKSLAVKHNFLFVGEAPFYKQAEAVSGKPYRYVSFQSFCDVRVGMEMADYNDAYTAFMPCRIAIVQDAKTGRLTLQTLSLDFMIYGGKPLPPHLKAGAIRVWKTIQEIMNGAARGEF